MKNYLHDMQIVQNYAAENRAAMLDEIKKGMKWKSEEKFSCVHNYIQKEDDHWMLRKGAISSRDRETVVIPIHMKDGVIPRIGKENPDWNCSAPHGSGRLLKRSDVQQNFTVSNYKKAMNGVYSSCIGKNTLDEAPFAYRGVDEIAKLISDSKIHTNFM